jgi:hypothetical protein
MRSNAVRGLQLGRNLRQSRAQAMAAAPRTIEFPSDAWGRCMLAMVLALLALSSLFGPRSRGVGTVLTPDRHDG